MVAVAMRLPSLIAAFSVIDAVILIHIPPVPTRPTPLAALIVATVANVALVAVVSRLVATSQRGSRASMSQARSRMWPGGGAVAALTLMAGSVGLGVAGLAARQTVVVETDARAINADAVRAYVRAEGDSEVRRNLETAGTRRVREGVFRNCVAYDDRRRAFCFFVDTTQRPATVLRDASSAPNPPPAR